MPKKRQLLNVSREVGRIADQVWYELEDRGIRDQFDVLENVEMDNVTFTMVVDGRAPEWGESVHIFISEDLFWFETPDFLWKFSWQRMAEYGLSDMFDQVLGDE